MFFASVVLINMGEAALQRILRNQKTFVLDCIRFVFISFTMTYMGSSFILLDASATLKTWHGTYYFGHLLCFVPLILEMMLRREKKVRSSFSSEDKGKSE